VASSRIWFTYVHAQTSVAHSSPSTQLLNGGGRHRPKHNYTRPAM